MENSKRGCCLNCPKFWGQFNGIHGGGIWTDITATYAGLYFRAGGPVGGTDNSSGAFNAGGVTVQGEGLPNLWGAFNLSSTQYDDTANPQGVFWQTSSNAHSDGGGSYNSPYSRVDFNAQRFNHIYGSSAHVPPVNTAIRIWKRTS